MYHFNHVWMYRSLVLSAFTLLCNHRHHPSPECSSSSQTETLPLPQRFPISPFPQAPATILLLSVSMDLTTLATSHTWNHTCPSGSARCPSWHEVFKGHPCCHECQNSTPSKGCIVFCVWRGRCVQHVWFLCPSNDGHLGFWRMSFLRMLHYKSKPKYPFSHPVLRHILQSITQEASLKTTSFYCNPILVFQNEWLFNTQPKAFLKLILTFQFLFQYIKSKGRFNAFQEEHLY